MTHGSGQKSGKRFQLMQSVGEGHKAGSEIMCMHEHIFMIIHQMRHIPFREKTEHRKIPQSSNRESIFGRVTRLREFDYFD